MPDNEKKCNGYTCAGEFHDVGCSLGGMAMFGPMTPKPNREPYWIEFSQGNEYDVVSNRSRTPRRFSKHEAVAISQWLNESYKDGIASRDQEVSCLARDLKEARADAAEWELDFITAEASEKKLSAELAETKDMLTFLRNEKDHSDYWVMKLREELSETQDSLKKVTIGRDEALTQWHAHQKNVPCLGCEGGHDTYWKSVVESPQWLAWEKAADGWDVIECQACGHISQKHFQAFMKFVVDTEVSQLKKEPKEKS